MHNSQTRTKTHTYGIRTSMRILKIFTTISILAIVTGCLEIATSELKDLTVQLLNDPTSKWEASGNCLTYQLKDKRLLVLSDGSVTLMVDTAAGQTPITICTLQSEISKLFVQKAGVKQVPESFVSGDNDVKEALIYEAIKEINQTIQQVQEAELEIESQE